MKSSPTRMSNTEHFFLKSKLIAPSRRECLVERPSLIARLNEGLKRGFVLVSAPAGFGKTTALAQWAVQSTLPVAWLSLDEKDNDPARFFSYLWQALLTNGIGDAQEHALLRQVEELPARTLAVAFLNWVEQMNAPFALVLDDYHLITAAPIHEALALFLECRPPSLYLIVTTRADPPLPLARLRALGALAEVRADDLRFNPAETTIFLELVMELELSPADTATLVGRTEGWIAGLQLAALSLKGRDDAHQFIERFSGTHRFILDYLIEEVVNRQPPAVRQFLMATSILERLSGPLCEAVTARSGGQQMLAQLEAANLFLVPLDEERRWYRYHHLFGELLQARLQQTEGPEMVVALHRRAAAWYERQGWPVEAIEHTLATGDVEQAAELVERHGHTQWGMSNATFLRLIGRLPPQMLSQRPRLGIYHAWTLIVYGQIRAAEQLLRELSTRLDEPEMGPEMEGVRAFVDLLLAYTPVLLGAPPTTGKLPATTALAQVPDDYLAMRNSADVVYAYLLYLRGELETAACHLLVPVERDLAVEGTTAIPISISRSAEIRQVQGRLREADKLCRHYVAYVAERGKERFFIAGNLELVLGDLLRERGEMAAAQARIAAGLETNEPWRVPHAQATGALTLARLQFSLGQVEAALETVTGLERQIEGRIILPAQRSQLQALKIRLWLAGGEADRAVAWATGLNPLPPLSFVREPELIALARVWIADGRLEGAGELLHRIAEAAAVDGREGRLLEIDLLQAVVLDRLGQREAAVETVGDCLRRAAAEGYVRLFLDEGAPVRELLAATVRSSRPEETGYARRLLALFPSSPKGVAHSGQDLVEPLTPRELEVLHLLCEGHANRTIAERLTITVSTVKKHAGNVYGKLGVDSRAQAMVRARELRLVPPIDPTP